MRPTATHLVDKMEASTENSAKQMATKISFVKNSEKAVRKQEKKYGIGKLQKGYVQI